MKNIKILAGTFALAAIVGVNLWNATTSLQGTVLNITDVEALADPEINVYIDLNGSSRGEPTGTQAENHFETKAVDDKGVEYFKVICAPSYSKYVVCNPVGNEFWLPTGNVVTRI